jgi:hypothetical protein
MRLFHRTYRRNADAILRDGFRNATGNYLTKHLYKGVWFSNEILDENEGANGDTVLSIDLPEEVIANYEWIEEGKPYREWLIPARVANGSEVTEIPESEE